MPATNGQAEKVFLLSSDICASKFKMEYHEVLGIEARKHFNFQRVPIPIPGFVLKSKKGEISFFPTSNDRYLLFSESQLKAMTGETDIKTALERANNGALLRYFSERIKRAGRHAN